MAKIKVQNTEITIVSHNDDDYISFTDMARSQLQEMMGGPMRNSYVPLCHFGLQSQ